MNIQDIMHRVGEIGNYYGGLFIYEQENKFYWIIENYDTDFENLSEWDEIPKSLYEQLSAISVSS